MIPRRIYLIWLSNGPMSEKDMLYVDNIKKYCSNNNYQYILIDSSSSIFKECLSQSNFCLYFYNKKQLTYSKFNVHIVDYLRCWILDKYGGIYLDTDISIDKDKNLDCLLNNNYFIGYESIQNPSVYCRRFDCGTVASTSNNVILQTFIKFLDTHPEIYDSGNTRIPTKDIINTDILDNSMIWPSMPELLPFIIKEVLHKLIVEVNDIRPLLVTDAVFEIYGDKFFSRNGEFCTHYFLNRY